MLKGIIKNNSLFSYLIVGIGCTFGVFLLWNVFIFLGRPLISNYNILFSVSQYLAAFLMIFPSFYLNRKLTFGSKNFKNNSFKRSTIKAYTIYLLAPLIASLVTYLLQSIYNFELVSIKQLGIDIKLGRFFLQFVGLAIGFAINYFGQKFWIYD